jgi:SET domain-containing protein
VPKTPADQPFEIRSSRIQGRGAFATRRIRPGQRVAEYVGDRITPEEGDRRYQEDGMNRHHTFLFTLDEHTVIDGKRKGNDSRYINHSCDPNCEAIIEDDRIFVHAKKNIQPGTELTYDYQYERHEDHDESTERFYVCHCGSPKCRGTILKPEKKKRAKPAAKKGSAKKTRSRTAAR